MEKKSPELTFRRIFTYIQITVYYRILLSKYSLPFHSKNQPPHTCYFTSPSKIGLSPSFLQKRFKRFTHNGTSASIMSVLIIFQSILTFTPYFSLIIALKIPLNILPGCIFSQSQHICLDNIQHIRIIFACIN